MRRKLFALFAAAALLLGMSACENEDNPLSPEQEQEAVETPAQLKQGVWTEYDGSLEASGKYTEEELAAMPALGMIIEGDKAYFFEYTADDVSVPVEGQISYDSATGKGSITFPTIKDNPLSGQTVSFNATTDETLEFEFTYEGQKATANCAWLCEDLDNWGEDVENEEWKELMAYYEGLDADLGPDPTIDWGDLDEPLVWDETPKANTRMVTAVLEGISAGFEIFTSLFEPDPTEEINAKLDALMEKVDQVLQNQQVMMAKLDQIDQRLIAIAQKLNQQETVGIFNNRNEKFYSKFVPQNTAYFDDAYAKYKANKNDPELKDYAEAWVGENKEYINLTWQYAEYITTVTHSKYGTGMDKIYDGITFEKYPWESLGIGDRKNYRAYDLVMLSKCIFMISLYAQHCQTNKVIKRGYYKNFDKYREKLLAYSKFNITNPDKFIVCQIPGAHFVMHKELQKYYYCGLKKRIPDCERYGSDIVYYPQWHQAGNIKIENPKELKSKLITRDEAEVIYKYYAPNKEHVAWTNMIVEGENAGGAVYAQKPQFKEPALVLVDPQNRYGQNGMHRGTVDTSIWLSPVMRSTDTSWGSVVVGYKDSMAPWNYSTYKDIDYYAAIVAKRF